MTKPARINIGDQCYLVTPNEWGWRVTCCKDMGGRSYEVFRADNGGPCRCTCPDHHYRGNFCKHMKAIVDFIPPSWVPESEEL